VTKFKRDVITVGISLLGFWPRLVFRTYIQFRKFGVLPSPGARKERNLRAWVEQKKQFSVSGYSSLACSARFFTADKRTP